jgi:hypothetical protein
LPGNPAPKILHANATTAGLRQRRPSLQRAEQGPMSQRCGAVDVKQEAGRPAPHSALTASPPGFGVGIGRGPNQRSGPGRHALSGGRIATRTRRPVAASMPVLQ